MRDRLNWVEFNARPEAIWAGLTIDGTIDWNEGMESASVMPITSESIITIHGRTVPASRSNTITEGQSIWIDWNNAITPPIRAVSQHTPHQCQEYYGKSHCEGIKSQQK